MYMNTLLHCHFCMQIIPDHFLLIKVSHPIHTIPGINSHLLYPILCPWKYSIRHKLLYCPVCMFGCFHGNQCYVASCHYFYTWGVLQEVDIISTVRPYNIYLKNKILYFGSLINGIAFFARSFHLARNLSYVGYKLSMHHWKSGII